MTCCNLLHFVFTTTTTVLRPFIRDYPGELVPEETFPCHSGFYGAGDDNRRRYTDNPAGQSHLPVITVLLTVMTVLFTSSTCHLSN